MSTAITEMTDLTNQLLIAMPTLDGSFFGRSVTLICEHDEQGAMGLVINKTADISVGSLLSEINITTIDAPQLTDMPVLTGGPVQTDRGFVLHTGANQWSSGIALQDNVNVTTSKDILESLSTQNAPDDFILTLGYAGWSAGQLEGELADNAWLTIESDHDLLFHTPIDKIWESAINKLGININQLSSFSGHA